jgi:glutamyl-tRNA synthetase
MSNSIRVRFPPSPTGDLHVGNVRSALFNWAYARHTGGSFVFRIEDTDQVRSTEESYLGLLDDMRWLGLDWDEGPEVGGPYAPYRQSERADIYADVLRKLLEGGYVYEAFSTPEEVEARHVAAGRNPKLGYDNFDRQLTDAQKAAYRAEGRSPVLRFRMPDEPIVFDDLVRGKTTFDTQHVPDFALTRADGSPLYTLTNPVDDATQHISHIVRGEDLMPSTPRQIPLHQALRDLGIVDAPMPLFGHLPMVMGEGNQRLSKRKTPEASLKFCRERGYLPEGLKNYLALLGWAIAEDRDLFSIPEMIEAFDITDVNANPARFDVKKSEAINAAWIRRLSTEDFSRRLADFLPEWDRATLVAAAPLVQERINLLSDARDMLAFLFVDGPDFGIDESARKRFDADIVRAALGALEPVTDWTTERIETALRDELVGKRELKPRKAFVPVQVAVTGKTVAPPLFQSMQLLGRERSLARLRGALA